MIVPTKRSLRCSPLDYHLYVYFQFIYHKRLPYRLSVSRNITSSGSGCPSRSLVIGTVSLLSCCLARFVSMNHIQHMYAGVVGRRNGLILLIKFSSPRATDKSNGRADFPDPCSGLISFPATDKTDCIRASSALTAEGSVCALAWSFARLKTRTHKRKSY